MTYSMLAVFAHPDDESFGLGGTLAKCASRGMDITLITASQGEQSTQGHSLEYGPKHLGPIREQELRCAARALGINTVTIWGFEDSRIQNVADEQLQDSIRSAVESVHPAMLLTFDPAGIIGNPDHIAVSQAVTNVFHEYQKARDNPSPPTSLYYWVVPDSIAAYLRKVSRIPFVGVPEPSITTILNVSEFLDRQNQAISCHRTQSDPMPCELIERLKAQAGREFFIRLGQHQFIEELENDRLA